MIEYIYIIENTVSGKLYVGRTNNPKLRQRGHFSELRRGVHNNPKLQSSYNKHGEDAFSFSVVDACDGEAIREREQEWFDKFNRDTSILYNCHFQTHGGPIITGPLAEETKLKISEAIKDNTRKYIFSILDERYSDKASLRQLSDKYGVGINTICSYIPEWEAKTGLVMIANTQIEQTLERVERFIQDYDKGLANLSHAPKYGTTVQSIRKYCVSFDREPSDFKGDTFKQDAKQRALNAIQYMKDTGCSAAKAIRDCKSSTTTFYKYLNQA